MVFCIFRIAALAATTALASCSMLGAPVRGPLATFPAPKRGDGGIEIARTSMLQGAKAQSGKIGLPDDCYGPGLGVLIEGTQGNQTTVFDAQGEPCNSASILFDGAAAIGKRQADPTVTIRVHDSFGTLLEERPQEGLPNGANRHTNTLGSLPAIPKIYVNEELVTSTAATTNEDPLNATLQQWQRADTVRDTRSEAATAASTRELNRLVVQAADTSSGAAAAALAAQLRGQERLLEDERRRHEQTLADSAQNRAVTQATKDAWAQEQNRLESELAAAKTRASQFEALAERMQQEKTRKEAAMGERIASLSGSLKLAEQQAETGRRELILQAAAKVAEAQALATAARLETQNDQLSEATRLHAQANELMDQVLMVRGEGAPDGAIEPAAGPASTNLPLLEAPVVLQAKERTLPDILTEVLQQAAAQSGAWRAEWQLGAKLGEKGPKLLNEKWSLTAEATVGQILNNLQQQVQEAHGVSLKFTPFLQTRVLVITGE